MTKSENNDQYLDKNGDFSPLPKIPLCVYSCVCSRPPKQTGRRPNLHSTQLTPRVIYPEIIERFSWNLGKTNIFPLGTCHFFAHVFAHGPHVCGTGASSESVVSHEKTRQTGLKDLKNG